MSPSNDPMPVFAIKAKDLLAVPAIQAYRHTCAAYGLHEQAAEVDKALAEVKEWQARNYEALKMPDHPHVPARPGRPAVVIRDRQGVQIGDGNTQTNHFGG